MQVDKTRVILACRIIINDLLGKLYRHQLVALIIAVIFFVTAGIAGGIFK